MNIVLIGYRGAGKTVVGKRLADRLQRRFVDTDDLLEKRHGDLISNIVKSHGWEHFRAMEKGIIKEISVKDHLVIAPGGGAVLDSDNVAALKRNGLIIWLKADRHVLRKRMVEDQQTLLRRPTLTGKGILEELDEVMTYREPFYERAAEVQIDTSALDVELAVENIMSIFQKRLRRA